MATFQAPVAHRRRLLRELKRYREEAKRTQRDVAQALEWSPSKVIRIESGNVQISMTDLRALLGYYGVVDRGVVEDLVATARESRKQSWTGYRDVISQDTADYFGLEASAASLRQYQSDLIPGLLQTPGYTRAILADVYELSSTSIERHVEARAERQELLAREDRPSMFFIVSEAAIKYEVGGATVMLEQLDRLESLGAQPGVSVQVIPFSGGAHPGMRGPFVLLESSDEADTVLYLENQSESVIRDDAQSIGLYLERFVALERKASDPSDLPLALAGARQGFADGGDASTSG